MAERSGGLPLAEEIKWYKVRGTRLPRDSAVNVNSHPWKLLSKKSHTRTETRKSEGAPSSWNSMSIGPSYFPKPEKFLRRVELCADKVTNSTQTKVELGKALAPAIPAVDCGCSRFQRDFC